MQQSFVVSGLLFPSHEDAAVAVEPRCNAFDDQVIIIGVGPDDPHKRSQAPHEPPYGPR